ncbi:transcription antitermination factor NusB [Allonocardiopsis opalescens]|uniref:Transcription antitermination protein NusB n=1 Tax=Allonocardiopsis opalescens TaxID=1144618 RepID=A0A2T0Q3T6_9ACTN|nr:transcription antitermination factor NusB [Allonocardiopsis opalescens]PRX98470.1 NusB antitermination factor [Allonocardiopsis opalescens]
MAKRTKARKRALDVLYEAELRGLAASDVLKRRVALADPPINPYTADLVDGIGAHAERIDELLTEHAIGWTLDRMPVVDRNILRIGLFELLWGDDVPEGVAISEAVLLAKEMSTDESPVFINGLLSRLLELKPSLNY